VATGDVAADCGTEELRLAAEHRGPIDLRLTDMILLGLSGRQVAEELRGMHLSGTVREVLDG
jgi:hypothetical protein